MATTSGALSQTTLTAPQFLHVPYQMTYTILHIIGWLSQSSGKIITTK